MNIRRFWRLCSLTVASLFWASCTDSNTQSQVTQPVDSDPSADVNGNSSSEGLLSSATVPESSSSGNPVASSGSYVLAIDPSVTCKVRTAFEDNPNCKLPLGCDDYERLLKKDTTISEKILMEWEEELQACEGVIDSVGLLYGSPAIWPCAGYRYYYICECSNGSTYGHCRFDEKNLAYRNLDEYNEINGISSSSVAESSSSSATDLVKSCPQGDFVLFEGILADVQKALYEKFSKRLEEDSTLTESGKKYLEDILNHEKKALKYGQAPYRDRDIHWRDRVDNETTELWFEGFIAKTKTCEDGTPVITERYQQKYDAILAECIEIIEEKIKPEE